MAKVNEYGDPVASAKVNEYGDPVASAKVNEYGDPVASATGDEYGTPAVAQQLQQNFSQKAASGTGDYVSGLAKDKWQSAIGVAKGIGKGVSDLNKAISYLSPAGIAANLAGLGPKTPKFLEPTNPQQTLGEPIGETLFDIGTSFVPMGKAGSLEKLATGETGVAIEKAGRGVVDKALSLLQSGMKPTDVTSKLAAKNVMDGAKKIMRDISTHGLESPTQGFEGIVKNSQNKIDSEMGIVDKKITDAMQKNPILGLSTKKTLESFKQDILAGKVDAFFGNEEAAGKYVDGITNALNLRGKLGYVKADVLPEIKSLIKNYTGGVFKRGAPQIGSDPVKEKVGDFVYLKFKKELESKVPEIAKHNNNVHDLINVRTAAQQAVKKIGNKYKIGLRDWAIILGLEIGTKSWLGPYGPLIAAPILAKKALSAGRGSSALLKIGKLLQSEGEKTAGSVNPKMIPISKIGQP